MEFAEIFTEYKYNKIIVLDDDFAKINGDTLIAEILSSNPGLEYDITKFGYDEDTNLDTVIRENPNLYQEIINSIGINTLVDFINNVKEVLEIKTYKKYDESILADCNEQDNILWIIDRKLGDTGNFLHITKLFEKFIDNRKRGNNDIFLLYTSDKSGFTTYDEVYKYLFDNLHDEEFVKNFTLYFNVLNKETLITSDLIFEMIVKANESEFFINFKNVVGSSLERIKSAMWENNDYKSLYCYDYLQEGLTLEDNLYGIVLNNVDYCYRDSKKNNINSTINLNKAFDLKFNKKCKEDIQIISHLGRALKVINKYQYINEIDTTINKLKLEIAFGDIIRINTKNYIVVSQQCDLTVRNDGTRTLDRIKLLPIKLDECDDKKIIKNIINEIIRINARDHFEDEVLEKVLTNLKNIFSAEKLAGYNIEMFNDKEKIRKAHEERIIGDFVKINGKTYNVSYAPKDYELNIKSYFFDIMSQNENGILRFSKAGINKSKCTRYPFTILLDNAYQSLREEIINNTSFTSDNFEHMLSLVYGFNSKFIDNYYNVEFSRIGRLPISLTKQIYLNAIEKQTREAKMEYVKIN